MYLRPISGIVRSIAAVGVATVIVQAAHAAVSWSDSQPLPDGFQGKIHFQFEKPKSGGYVYRLTNGYDQRVTVQILLNETDSKSVADQSTREIVLEPGEQKADELATQTAPGKDLVSVALRSIKFSAAPPTPTALGFYVPMDDAITALKKQIKDWEEGVRKRDEDVNDARADRLGANAEGGGSTYSPGDAKEAAHGVELAESKANKDRKHLEDMKARLAAAIAANDAAKGRAEERAHARIQEIASRSAAAPDGAKIVASSGTTSETVSNTVVAAPSPEAAPAGIPAVPALATKAATLTGDQMKSLYKTAGEAAGKKDWPTVETSLRQLLDGSGEAIKTKDRADLYYRLGTAYDNDNKAAEADAAYTEAIRLGVVDDSLYNELATVQYSEGKLTLAEKSERSAIEKRSDNSSYFFNLGLICMAQKKYKDAETAFRSALRLDPDNEQIKQHVKTAQDAQKAG